MIKNKRITCILFTLLTIFFVSGCNSSSTNKFNSSDEEISGLTPLQKKYQDSVETFETVETSDLSTKNDSYFLYTGRITCPYCLSFVPKLYEASLSPDNTNLIIRYLDSENEDDTGLESFIKSNNIEYVPHFSYYKDGALVETMNVIDTTTTVEIQKFIDSMKSE